MAQQGPKATADQSEDGLLIRLSNELAGTVARVGQYVVRVNAGRRLSSSGIVWSGDGVIVTADHAIEDEEGITVALPNGKELPAKLVGRDPGTDLAVLQIQASGLTSAQIAERSSINVGSLVLAVGRPMSTGLTSTMGIISAMTGPWRTWGGGLLESLIQADISLHPGFSGGPLVNAAGQMVGLNSSILIRGLAAAVPIDTIQQVVTALQTQGRVRRGYLGISTQPVPLPAQLAQRLQISQPSGLLIVKVEQGSPADQAGLLLGDLLITIAGRGVRTGDEIQGILGPDQVGKTLQVKLVRGGELREIQVIVGERS